MKTLLASLLLLTSFGLIGCGNPERSAAKYAGLQGLINVTTGEMCPNKRAVLMRATKSYALPGQIPILGSSVGMPVSEILCCDADGCFPAQ